MKKLVLRNLCLFALAVGLSSCVGTYDSVETRIHAAKATLNAAKWRDFVIETGEGPLWGAMPSDYDTGGSLWIFIEGDGLSWLNRRVPSANPTPSIPVGLSLGLRNKLGPSAYLARPCQYIVPLPTECAPQRWLSGRFSDSVIEQIDEAIDQVTLMVSPKKLHLVGFSGGAAIVMRLAVARADVTSVVTVAGNIDPDKWAYYHRLSPLASTDKDIGNYRAGVRYLHLYGENDSIVPQDLVRQFPSSIGMNNVAVRTLPVDHHCCWAANWHEVVSAWLYDTHATTSLSE